MKSIEFTSLLLATSCYLGIALAAPKSVWSSPHDTSGCGKEHKLGYSDVSSENSIQSDGKTRFYGVYVPKSYNEDTQKQRKLIFDYHGAGGTSRNQYNNSMYYKYPEGEEYLVVYPLGWNGTGDSYWEGTTDKDADKTINDRQFTTDLLAHIRQQYCVDSDHVYASGKSLGGGFANLLACSDNGDEFAAFGMAAAALYTDNSLSDCSKRRAILEAHGYNDSTISYQGGDHNNGHIPNIADWIDWWGQRDGFSIEDKNVSADLGGYNTVTYTCKGGQEYVKHYNISKLGHCWPSSTGDNSDSSRSYCKDHSLDFTPIVLDFFSQWDLRNSPKQGSGW